MSLLARRYATALFAVAEERGATAQVLADLQRVAAFFAADEAQGILGDPSTPRAALGRVVAKLLTEGHELTRDFAQVLLARRREELLPEMADALQTLIRVRAGEVEALVETAMPLSDADQAGLRDHLARVSGKRIIMRVETNPDVIAGVRVRVGNTLYDGSLQGELEALHRHLLQASVTTN